MTIGNILEHHYRIVELIGTGGMAHVYRAVSIATGRSVAVKVIREEFREDPEFLRRFEQEAKAVLRLSQENIVRAYGVGTFDGLPYLIMEYVQGRTLKAVLQDNGPMPAKTAISITCQILQALHAAHSAGIIHRDVKPHNVILTRDGRAKLTDFGIARDTNETTRTMAGDKVIGSVQYISPEQAQGLAVTESSDIYSVGVMLYEMLTGTVPFDGDTAVSVALRHINDEPREPRSIMPQVSPALNAIVMHALQKQPRDRYLTAREMRGDLLKAERNPSGTNLSFATQQETEPSTEKTVPEEKPAGKPHRHNFALPLIILAVLLLIGAIAGTFLGVKYYLSGGSARTQPVPQLCGKTYEEAAAKAEDYGFTVTCSDREYSDTIPAGCVISQSPDAGGAYKNGNSISVVVSLGMDTDTIPDLVGMTLDEAREALAAMGMEIGSVTYRISDVAIGYICGQSLPAGSDGKAGDIIDVSVSALEANFVELPDVVGLSYQEAVMTVSDAGFDRIFISYGDASLFTDGQVTAESPAPGDTLRGSAVTLTICGSGITPYSADYATNITSQVSGTQVTVILDDSVNGIPVSRIVYETVLESTDTVPLSFTVYAFSEGLHELTVTVGNESRTYEVELTAHQ